MINPDYPWLEHNFMAQKVFEQVLPYFKSKEQSRKPYYRYYAIKGTKQLSYFESIIYYRERERERERAREREREIELTYWQQNVRERERERVKERERDHIYWQQTALSTDYEISISRIYYSTCLAKNAFVYSFDIQNDPVCDSKRVSSFF